MGRTGPRRVAGRAVGRRVGGQRWRSGHQKAVNSDIIILKIATLTHILLCCSQFSVALFYPILPLI